MTDSNSIVPQGQIVSDQSVIMEFLISRLRPAAIIHNLQAITLVVLDGKADKEYRGRKAYDYHIRVADPDFAGDLQLAMGWLRNFGEGFNAYYRVCYNGQSIATWTDFDEGMDSVNGVNRFAGELHVSVDQLEIVRTGTQPSERYQAVLFASEALPRNALARNKLIGEKIGSDRSVYNTKQLLRLPGSVAWPWKGGEFKAGRVAEVAAWRPAANRAERAALPELSMRPVGEPSEPRGLHFDIALEKQDAVAAAVVERVEAIPPFSHDEVIKEIHKAAALCNVGVLRDDQMDEIGAAGDRRSSSPKQDTYVDAVRRLHFENLNPGTTAWAEQVGEMIDKGHDPANAYRGINRTIQNDALIEQVKARALTGEILPPIINADEGPFAAIERLCQTAALKTIEPAQTARQPWYRVPYWELACPPVNWLVEGKIPRLLGLIHGQTHEGKTFVALNLIHCLTVGGNFCGVDVKPIADNEYVLYASFEDWAGVHVRLDALYGPDGELNKIAAHKLIVFPDYEANGGGADSLLMVVKAIEELRLEGRRCVLLVLDTLASSELIIKENDNDESIRLFNLLRRIMRSYQMAVLPIAHQSKSERDRDPEHRQSRGAGSKDGAVDFSLSVDRGKVSWSKLRGAPRPLPQQFDIVDNKLVWSNITAQSVRTLAPTALELGASFMACTSPVADPSNVKELTRLEVTNATRNMIAKYLGGNHTNELMTGAFLTTKAAIEFAIDRWIVTSGYGNGTVADLLGNLTASRAAKSVGSFVILDAIMFAPPVPVVSVQLQPMIPFMPPFKPFKT